MSTDPDFYMSSTESYDLQEPRRCWKLHRVTTPNRDDFLLVSIDPPIIGQQFGLGDQDVYLVLLATRHKGETLFPVSQWPVFVHVVRPLVDEPLSCTHLENDQFESYAWAEIYLTEKDARMNILCKNKSLRAAGESNQTGSLKLNWFLFIEGCNG